MALGALKPAHRLQPAARHCGTLLVGDIGIAVESRTSLIGRPHLPAPGPEDHKYSRGMVAVLAGGMPGAAQLAAEAAARSGAGYVLLAGETATGAGPAAIVRRAIGLPELFPILANPHIGAIVVGPGIAERDAPRAEAAFRAGRPLVIDAGAIAMARGRAFDAAVLTPHEGEFARVFGDLPGSKLDRARAAACFANAVVLLKGADSIVAAPDGRAAIAPPAPAWLATAGTGDVLAGIVAAMLARGLDRFDAACAALWLHGRAGEAAGPALIADDLLMRLPALIGACAH
ncbi:NAD(P)H-hydrate dehydratase [Sphingomonas naphthae]|uniref:NAD(P)H-hydrate dehydratase n=1 Tax=Sphingomonas naphthae TaxID=1813468 RepID=UPI00308110DD